VPAFRDRVVADGIELVEQWDEPDYVRVKCRDPGAEREAEDRILGTEGAKIATSRGADGPGAGR
jgi:hypothetical protein